MKARTVLVLAVLVAALASFIWFFERDLPSSDERAERAHKVLAFEPEDVSSVEIEWGGRTVRLERARPKTEKGEEGGGEEEDAEPAATPPSEWRLTEPLQARAERSLVEGLLTALGGLDKERTIEDADRSEMGLAEPRGRVTLGTEEGEWTLEIGADVPASKNVLVSLAGAPEVWVTSASFLTQLERSPGEWRSRDVFSVARDDVERVRLSTAAGPAGPARTVVLARRGGRFYLEKPVEDLAAADAVDRLLSDLVTLRVQRFLDSPGETPPPASELGLDPPREVVVAELAGEGEPLEVDLGAPVNPSGEAPAPASDEGPGGAVYARAGGQLFEAVTGLDEAAAKPARDWRSRSWTELRSYEVDRLEVTEPGAAPLTLVRQGVDWRRNDETIPYTAASDFLFALTDAEGDLPETGAAASPEAPAPGEPILTVTLASKEGNEETLTLYGAGESGSFPARSSARKAVLQLPAEAAAQVRRTLDAVRAAEPVAKEDAAEATAGKEGS